MKSCYRRGILIFMAGFMMFFVTSCGLLPEYFPEEYDDGDPTLADLKTVEAPEENHTLPIVSRAQVIASYHSLLDIVEDPKIRASAMARLASLMMQNSEDQQLLDTDQEQLVTRKYYAEVIGYYEALLEQYPGRVDNDDLYYQMAKAYDLDTSLENSVDTLGRLTSAFPNSKYAAEAHFRMGEIYFSNGQYKDAQNEYQQAVDFGNDTSFYDNALYMKGWSEFKRGWYEESLVSYVEVLDRAYPTGVELSNLRKTDRELVDDTLRVMALVFSYLDGADSIEKLNRKTGQLHYDSLLYSQLAELFLSKKRYKDSADTYQTFINSKPLSVQAPDFHVKMIDVYDQGDFPSLIMPAKQAYVESYGLASAFWRANGVDVHALIKPNLKSYIAILAQQAHSDAQQMKQLYAVKQGKPKALKKLKFTEEDINKEYRSAGRWYNEYIMTFPDDENVNDMWFLLAESQYEAEDYFEAIETYEQIAYQVIDHPKANESAYAALLTYDKYIESLSPELESDKVSQWQARQTDSAISFADNFPDDKRAPTVLAKAANDLLKDGKYSLAVNSAYRLVNWATPIDDSLIAGAWLVVAHGQFEEQEFALAEEAYLKTSNLLPKSDKRRVGIKENLAASIYKQGEALALNNKLLEAVAQFLRVNVVVPGSSFGANAEFDAATHLLTLKSWSEAIAVLEGFRRSYPSNKLNAEVPGKLFYAYQENEQWGDAARELNSIALNDTDPENTRQATIMAAELYQKSGNKTQAASIYERYVKTYTEPFSEQLEAQYQLSVLYQEMGSHAEYKQAVQTLITLDSNAGTRRTDRSRYLAAQGAAVLANDDRMVFESIRLSLPLSSSLKRKKQALDKVLQGYTQVADYNIEEFTTNATYNIGNIYAQLSIDLLDSDRPSNMNELELDQYEVLLEEQAFPFEEQAIDIHETNAQRSWIGIYDQWVVKSFDSLAKLMPGRYDKEMKQAEVVDAIH